MRVEVLMRTSAEVLVEVSPRSDAVPDWKYEMNFAWNEEMLAVVSVV